MLISWKTQSSSNNTKDHQDVARDYRIRQIKALSLPRNDRNPWNDWMLSDVRSRLPVSKGHALRWRIGFAIKGKSLGKIPAFSKIAKETTRASVTSLLANMLSTGFGKLCFVAALVEVLLGWNSVYSSSIYVGRNEAGTYTEEKPSTGILSEGKV